MVPWPPASEVLKASSCSSDGWFGFVESRRCVCARQFGEKVAPLMDFIGVRFSVAAVLAVGEASATHLWSGPGP